MLESPGLLMSLLAFIAVLGPVVFVHELGHYGMGRLFGVKANVFSIGFGKELFGWKDKRGTRWKVGALPLGGYVEFAGDMNPAGQPDPEWLALPAAERNQTFQAKPLWQRALIVFAGPAINFVMAFLLLVGLTLAYGQDYVPPTVGEVKAGLPAAAAGIKAGDRIVSINGETVDEFDHIIALVGHQEGVALPIVIERAGARQTITVTPRVVYEKDPFGKTEKRGMIGVAPAEITQRSVSVLDAPGIAAKKMVLAVRQMVDVLGQMVTGRRDIADLGGPVKIAEVSGKVATFGLASIIALMAAISVNLGFINLLPLPMLDGGHLAFYGMEAVRGKPVSARVADWAYRIGFAAIATMFLVVTFNDLGSVGLWERLGFK